MPREQKLFTCDEDHPNRCTSVGRNNEGQCRNLSMAGMLAEGRIEQANYPGIDLTEIDVCPRHGANMKIKKQENMSKRLYKLEKFKNTFSGKLEDGKVKDMSDEIILLRVAMQEVVNKCEQSSDILMYTSYLTQLTTRIESLINSMDRLEQRSGILMDKAKAFNIASRLIEAIVRKLPEDQKHILDEVAEEFTQIIKET